MNPSQQPDSPKIGAGHAGAMFRAGIKELSQILAAFPESVQPVEEYGLAGTKLPQEIHMDRHGPDIELDHNIELER